jgi:hypothetical protein
MTKGVTWRTENLTRWSQSHRGDIELNALARIYLGDAEITDRDRIAFALRELRKRGYDVEACPVDWTRPLMICSVQDSVWIAFGEPQASSTYKRLDRIAKRSRLVTDEDFQCIASELYGEELYDSNDFLEEPYEFCFKGDPALVESVFQAVGFATQHGVMVPDDGSEPDHLVRVAPPIIVID